MCGIFGQIFKSSNSAHGFNTSSKGFLSVKSRGPDGYGLEHFHCHGHSVSLAHTRLSIIELSELGAQPMKDDASGWWVSYNGEIYNYLEIREELCGLGSSFCTGSDTEVLLKAWAQWGADALPRIRGMFAFAAFNPDSGELWLVRDRFGVKPLAWGRMPDGRITFSSSVAGTAAQVSEEIDTTYCARGLRYKIYEVAQSGSPFKNIKSVSAGGWLRFKLSESGIKITEGRWYDLKQAVAARAQLIMQSSDDDLLEECRQLLESAVKLRLRSDVPVAVSLSAGLDSSTIAALASRQVTGLRGFTYGSPSAKASEGPDAKIFSDALGIKVTYIWPRFDKAGLSDALERTMACQEAPFSGLSVIAQNEVFRSVLKAGYKVLLGGQGGDESFAGYRKFFVVALREALQKREPGNALRLIYSLGLMMTHEAGQARMYWKNLNRYSNTNKTGFRLLDWEQVSVNLWGNAGDSLSERQIDDIQQWSMPTLLRYEDRNSMGYGVESRLPFMDHCLTELALALPARLKIANGYGKWMLRKMAAGTVPDLIRLNRRKRGFDVTQQWISDGIGASLRSRIFENRHALSGHLKKGVDLDRLLSDTSLTKDVDILDEALMLAWLVKPVRLPVDTAAESKNEAALIAPIS